MKKAVLKVGVPEKYFFWYNKAFSKHSLLCYTLQIQEGQRAEQNTVWVWLLDHRCIAAKNDMVNSLMKSGLETGE